MRRIERCGQDCPKSRSCQDKCRHVPNKNLRRLRTRHLVALGIAGLDDERLIEAALNSTCQMFREAIEKPRKRYRKESGLVQELRAEDDVYRCRVQNDESVVVTCED